jgi:hypothetical protein
VRIKEKEEVLSLLQQHRDSFRELGVKRLGLFGSFVRGEQTDSSDIDILVEFEPERKTFDNFIRMAFLLTFGASLRRLWGYPKIKRSLTKEVSPQ